MAFTLELIAVLVAIAAFCLSLAQTVLGYVREKKEATLRAYYELQDDSFYPLYKLIIPYKNGRVNFIRGDAEWNEITNCMEKIENFSAGVNLGVYSLRTVDRIHGAFVIKRFDDVKDFIEEKRKEYEGTQYCEFEKMVDRLRKRQKTKKIFG